MGKWSFLIAVVVVLSLLLACGVPTPTTEPEPTPAPSPEPPSAPETAPTVPPEKAHLRANPVEESMPIYGGTITMCQTVARTFDGHESASYGPMCDLPTFNQLVIFDNTYRDCVLENIIGDLAESWEVSADGLEYTFKLRQGVKWHDGMPFTAEDVVYSLDKMTDPNRSNIAGFFQAYESAEKIDDYTVKLHLKRPSAGFMLSLASGDAVIQAKHLEGTDPQTAEFMIGTGPFILTDYKTRLHLMWKRNPDYFKKDKYGNQLPYLDGLVMYQSTGGSNNEMFVARRLDLKSTVTCASTLETYTFLKEGAPELVWQERYADACISMQLNLEHPPLDDIRVRRAMALVINQEDLCMGYTGDPMFRGPGTGFLPPAYGLTDEEVAKLLGWDKPFEERVAEAKKLMAEAGYPEGGFTMRMVTSGSGSTAYIGADLVLAEALRKYLGINAEVRGLEAGGLPAALDAGEYEMSTGQFISGSDPVQLQIYFRTGASSNHMHYSNPRVDEIFDNLDQEIDPAKRREMIHELERILLTDLPGLPTGLFLIKFMANYPHVKNLRYNDTSYSNVCRLEDVWIDPSLKPADFGTN